MVSEDSDFEEIPDRAFVSYFIGSTDKTIGWSDKKYEESIDPFFTKMSEEVITDMNSWEIYDLYMRLIDCSNLQKWCKKFELMQNMQYKAQRYEGEDQNGYPSNIELMSFFIGYSRWLYSDTENWWEVRENFLKSVRKALCESMEWEDVLDLLYFFDTEEIIKNWDDILIDKLGIRKIITRNDKEEDEFWNLTDEGIEMHHFQEKMK